MLPRLLPLLSLQIGSVVCSIPLRASRTYAAAAASMSLVKDLREKSGAPISDVKSALVEANWDLGIFLACLEKFHHALMGPKHGNLVCCRLCLSEFAKEGSCSCIQKGLSHLSSTISPVLGQSTSLMV